MQFTHTHLDDLGVGISLAAFVPEGKRAEWHAMIHVEPRGEMFPQQYERLLKAEARLMARPDMAGAQPVCRRYFLSDATNQQPLMTAGDVSAGSTAHNVSADSTAGDVPADSAAHAGGNGTCATACIQQPPLDGSKVALWLYLQRGGEVVADADRLHSTVVRSGGYQHIWTMGMTASQGDSYQQTQALLEDYGQLLTHYGATLADHCLRTWFFVRDVDTWYHGLVVARRDIFTRLGLTPATHYIASTGIGGSPAESKALIQLGGYAVTGFEPRQQRYLYAPTHLGRTSDYGVTFERGTLMQYGDRNHIFISGTASINNQGEVMHVGDIGKQTERMCENVEMLLREGGMTMDDAMQVIVYLRDTADYDTVSRFFASRYPHTPTVITLAPVCRPTWLIEMECIAVREASNGDFRNF